MEHILCHFYHCPMTHKTFQALTIYLLISYMFKNLMPSHSAQRMSRFESVNDFDVDFLKGALSKPNKAPMQQRFSFWRRGRSSAGEETAGERPRGACNGEAARRCVWVWTGDRSERSLKRCRTSVSCYEKGAKRVGHDRRAQYDWGRRLRVLGCWSVGADLQTAHHEIQHGFPGGKAVVT